jgi:hypothetical protein
MKKNKLIGLILILLGNTLLINARTPVDTLSFRPDTTVNRILILSNPKSTFRFYPKIAKEKDIKFFRCNPVYIFSNASKNECLITYMVYGGVKYGFGCFEIGILKETKNKVLETKYSHFETESGVKLGLSLKDLIKIKGKDYIKKGNQIFYTLGDSTSTDTNDPFLKKHNQYFYYLECTFEKDKIVKIIYGFRDY